MEGWCSNSKPHVAPGLNEKSQIWTYFKRDFCDFFAILSAHEIFESHLEILNRALKFLTNFKNRYQIISNPYILTSRESRLD